MPRNCLILIVAVGCCLLFPTCEKPIVWDEFEQRTVTCDLEILGSAGDFYEARLADSGIDAACSATVVMLSGDSAVAKAGIAPDSSVWVVFRNGLYAGIFAKTFLQRHAAAAPAKPKVVRAAGGGEAVASSVIVAAFTDSLYWADIDAIKGMLDTCLGAGTATTIVRDAQVTVSRVREILSAGPGVLYWTGHGMRVPLDTMGTYTSGLVTEESYESPAQCAAAAVNEYGQGVRLGTNYIYIARHAGRFYLVVLPGFVTNHANFDAEESKPTNQRKSLVYLDCCHCLDYMSDAFLAKGADVCWGWDWTTDDSFAAALSNRLLRLATDTVTAGEATAQVEREMGFVCPFPARGKNAHFAMRGDGDIMVRAQMRMTKQGIDYRGYSVGVGVGDPATASCLFGLVMGATDYSLAVDFPAAAGTYDCVLQEDASIALTDVGATRTYFVSEDCRGVSGSITVDRFGEYVAGSFTGLLGYWQPPHDPASEPPDDTIRVENGFLKYTGRLYSR